MAFACVGLLVVLMTFGCQDRSKPAAPGSSDGSQLISNLFASVRSGKFPPEIEAYLSDKRDLPRSDPHWPTLTYLLGEAHRRRGETKQALESFRALATWAATNPPAGPYGDTWGGSGLAAVGLWRWLQILDQQAAEPGQIDQVLETAKVLQGTRLYSGMGGSGLLPALPLVEEDVARLLAHVAWKAGKQEAAMALFLDFLAIDSRGKLDEIDNRIRSEILSRHLADEKRLDLFRAKRQLDLVKSKDVKDEAAKILRRLFDDQTAPADVRAEAGYEWASYTRLNAASFRRNSDWRKEIQTALTNVLALAADPALAAKALYLRGTVHNISPGEKVEDFRADMNELLRRFPSSRLADDALFQLATDYLFEPAVDRALPEFGKLRNFRGPNDYLDSAYFLAALGLVGRDHEGDLAAADKLLAEYVDLYPDGPFRLRSIFWRGRIAERGNNAAQARVFFQQLIKEASYDYYALRARMHLDQGAGARSHDLPATDSPVRQQLREAYRESRVEPQITASSPYHQRLASAASSGLYRQLLDTVLNLKQRLDDIPLDDIERLELVPAAALLLSLRQDAGAAKDFKPDPENQLQLAGLLGHTLGDWPTAIDMALVAGSDARQRLAALYDDPRYLKTVYPLRQDLEALKQPLQDAAWAIDGSSGLSQSIMYSVIRNESRFYAKAISPVGALGLFQILPGLFKGVDDNRKKKGKQSLLVESGVDSDLDYLLDPARNVRFWAAWSKDEFPIKKRNDTEHVENGPAFAVMGHHAGPPTVRLWTKNYWSTLGAKDKEAYRNDLEYRIETARYNATRNFVRNVLRDTTIVEAVGTDR